MKQWLLEFLNVTELAALASWPWVSKGDPHIADEAAVTAMRKAMLSLPVRSKVVIGEGEMDQAPMLYIGEELGKGDELEFDIAVDPLDGTKAASYGKANAMTVIAAAAKGTLLHAPDIYMEKISVGPRARGVIDIETSVIENITNVAQVLGKPLSEVTVMIQERERHESTIRQIIAAGAKVKLFTDNDIIAAISPCLDQIDIDMFWGIGGAPEGVVASVAIRCMGGELQGRLLPQNEEQRNRCITMGVDAPEKKLTLNDMISSDQCLFVATGVTDGIILDGIRSIGGRLLTHSLGIFGGDGKPRFIKSYHPIQ